MGRYLFLLLLGLSACSSKPRLPANQQAPVKWSIVQEGDPQITKWEAHPCDEHPAAPFVKYSAFSWDKARNTVIALEPKTRTIQEVRSPAANSTAQFFEMSGIEKFCSQLPENQANRGH